MDTKLNEFEETRQVDVKKNNIVEMVKVNRCLSFSSHVSFWRRLKKHYLYSFLLQLVQSLEGGYDINDFNLIRWMIRNQRVIISILFVDECIFSADGVYSYLEGRKCIYGDIF